MENIRIAVNFQRWQNDLCLQHCKDLSCCWPILASFWKAVFPRSLSESCRGGRCIDCVRPLTTRSSLAESTCKPSWSSCSLRALLETLQSLGAPRQTQAELAFKICCHFCVHWSVWETLAFNLYNSSNFFKYCASQLYQLLCGWISVLPFILC